MIYKSLLSCSNNTRELGGIKTADGRVTRNGVFWRSDVPVGPAAEDIEKLLSHGVTTVMDMRTGWEAEKAPDTLSGTAGFEYHHFPITEGSGVPESLEAVPLSYMTIATAGNMPMVMKVLAEAKKGVLFHCTAGKDCTGVVTAIIYSWPAELGARILLTTMLSAASTTEKGLRPFLQFTRRQKGKFVSQTKRA